MNSDEILARVSAIVSDALQSGPVVLTRDTKAMQVRGWDSLSHTIILIALEDAFACTLPVDRTLALKNVGDLVDLIADVTSQRR
ncbi:acyl carrier protein [Nibricoccus aquaticus]|uniref:Acyl carrier protein n=1 Tax=Nibricoccus aquaticus TaxID=2576891 RepID=A0A290QCL6_9BACT|nr:phosphopantetheine-binding protein [Nibricoccus aquaticus]ATC64950.1 acyl carrier protein [Nibricoccus aquaticus]